MLLLVILQNKTSCYTVFHWALCDTKRNINREIEREREREKCLVKRHHQSLRLYGTGRGLAKYSSGKIVQQYGQNDASLPPEETPSVLIRPVLVPHLIALD